LIKIHVYQHMWRASYSVFERSGYGSRKENASKQKIRASVLIQSEPKRLLSGNAWRRAAAQVLVKIPGYFREGADGTCEN
jgi:hypothetical protein